MSLIRGRLLGVLAVTIDMLGIVVGIGVVVRHTAYSDLTVGALILVHSVIASTLLTREYLGKPRRPDENFLRVIVHGCSALLFVIGVAVLVLLQTSLGRYLGSCLAIYGAGNIALIEITFRHRRWADSETGEARSEGEG